MSVQRTFRIPWQATAAALALGPAVGVLAAREFGPYASPGAVSAAAVEPSTPAPVRHAVNVAELAAMDRLKRSASEGFGPAPFSGPVLRTIAEPAPKAAAAPSTAMPVRPAVTSIMKTNSGGLAVINGKLRRVGDVLDEGWEVEVIDPAAGEVVVTHPATGRVVLLLRTGG